MKTATNRDSPEGVFKTGGFGVEDYLTHESSRLFSTSPALIIFSFSKQACAGPQYVRRDFPVSLAPSVSAQPCGVRLCLHRPRPPCGPANSAGPHWLYGTKGPPASPVGPVPTSYYAPSLRSPWRAASEKTMPTIERTITAAETTSTSGARLRQRRRIALAYRRSEVHTIALEMWPMRSRGYGGTKRASRSWRHKSNWA